jgi:acyl-CoA thioester hydrolase
MDIHKMSLILARIEVDFVAQIYYGKDVLLKTWISKLGNSSFVVAHEAWQSEVCVARGQAVQVAFDFATQKSQRLPDAIRAELEKHLLV